MTLKIFGLASLFGLKILNSHNYYTFDKIFQSEKTDSHNTANHTILHYRWVCSLI